MIEFRQERSLRHKVLIERYQVYVDGKFWGIFHAYLGGSYLLHRGSIPLAESPRNFTGAAFEEAAKAACEASGVQFDDYTVTEEA
jgi:hypothetical protein